MKHASHCQERRNVIKKLGILGASPALISLSIQDTLAQTTIPIVLSTGLKLANYGPLYVAVRSGLFEQQGLRTTINVGGSVVEPVSTTLSDRTQFAATGTGMAVNSTVEGGNMKIIARMCGTLGMWVIARPGTVFTSLDDFKGKKVASLRYPSNTVTSPTFAMRKFAGFDPQTEGVEFLEGPPGSIIGAVRDQRADVGVVFEWDASIAVRQGLNIVYGFSEQFGALLLTSLMVKADYLISHSDVVQRFCNALAAAMKLTRENPVVYVDAMRAEFPNLDEQVIQDGCARLLATEGFVPINPVVTQREWDASIEHDFLAGTIRRQLDFKDMVDNSFAQKATEAFGLRG